MTPAKKMLLILGGGDGCNSRKGEKILKELLNIKTGL